jgi:hypothetical protein
LAFAAGPLPACSGTTTTPVTTSDADFVSCSTETRATPYQPGMQVTSHAGTFVVKLLNNTFKDANGHVLSEAPAKGVDVWTVEADAADTMMPLDGLTITVSPYMPDHLHGTTPVGVTAAGSGTYTIEPLNLYMAGYWEITLTITDPASGSNVADTAMLPICVPG